ncbi:hypothetical protein FQR65_LT01137 [Abscondita terminalis]|nr:hypothetical protein FQR65_LT01137 [Abscondita terminalis]
MSMRYYRINLVSAMIYGACWFLILLYFNASGQSDDAKNAKILFFETVLNQPNEYFFKFETSDGINREESGKIVKSKSGEENFVVRGLYSYIGPDNVVHARSYVADDKGYRETVPEENSSPEVRLGNRIGTPAIVSLQGGLG